MSLPATLLPENKPGTGMPIADLRREGEGRLRAAGVTNAAQETLWLLESLGIPRIEVLTGVDHMVSGEMAIRARALFARRALHEPLQYLLGTQDFCGHTFEVRPGVLIPRPETELLVEETVRLCQGRASVNVVDVGTGSGCLAVSVAKALPTSRVWAIDLSAAALDVARHNIRRHGVEDRVTAFHGDLLDPLKTQSLVGRVDVILSNPPYIAESEWASLPPDVAEYEPKLALDGGPDGLRVHRRLVDLASRWLVPDGWLLFEIGQNQHPALRACIQASGRYREIVVRKDDQGIDRMLGARTPR